MTLKMATTSGLSLRLVKIDSKDVENHPEHYNSNFHTAEEAPGLPIPIELPQHYSRWLPLIASSQRIPPHLIQTINLTSTQGKLVISVAQVSIHTRTFSRIHHEDVEETIFPALSALTFPPQGLFLRLDASSPKDAERGTQPLKTIEQIVLRLTTSYRAQNAITGLLDHGAKEIPLYFLPYNDRMKTNKEFRVLCPPGDGRIAAVSQYSWYAPSIFAAQSHDELEEMLKEILNGIQAVHAEIMEVVKSRGDELDELLLKQGFTFDVMWDAEGRRCQLIELNGFGSRSGCGTSLFHWLRDGDVLYGKREEFERREIEFRISI